MAVPQSAEVTFTSPNRVRDVIHNFNAGGFDSLKPKYAGGRPFGQAGGAAGGRPRATRTGRDGVAGG